MSQEAIAVLTSGGDAPGMNAAVRAVTRSAIQKGMKVIGVHRGYNGLLNGDVFEMNLRSVSNIIHIGGTILYTARSDNLFALCAVFNGRIQRRYIIKTAYISVFSLYHNSKSCYNEAIYTYRIYNNFAIIIRTKHRIIYGL